MTYLIKRICHMKYTMYLMKFPANPSCGDAVHISAGRLGLGGGALEVALRAITVGLAIEVLSWKRLKPFYVQRNC